MSCTHAIGCFSNTTGEINFPIQPDTGSKSTDKPRKTGYFLEDIHLQIQAVRGHMLLNHAVLWLRLTLLNSCIKKCEFFGDGGP